MSFSNEVKNELARLENGKQCCEKAELFGLLRMSGAIILRGRNMGIHFSTENAALARRVLQLFKNNYDVKTEVVITRSRRLKKNIHKVQKNNRTISQRYIAKTSLLVSSAISYENHTIDSSQCFLPSLPIYFRFSL